VGRAAILFAVTLPSLSIAVLSLALAATAGEPLPPPAEPAEDRTEALLQFAAAKLAAVEGDLASALAGYREAEERAPQSAYVRLEHARLLERIGQGARSPRQRQEYLTEAAEKIGAARRLAPDNVDVLRAASSIYLEQASEDPEALAAAKEVLEGVLQRDPADVGSAVTLGRLYLEDRQPAQAAEVLRELVRHVPQQRMAYALLVEALLRAERPAEAESALGEILAFDAGALEARLTLADLQNKRGDLAAATATLRAAPGASREDLRWSRQLAWTLYQAGDLAAAQSTLAPLVAADAADAAANQGLVLLQALVLAADGRNAEALPVLAKVREAEPEDIGLAFTASRVLEREGRHQEAAEMLGELAAKLADKGKDQPAREVRLEQAQVLLAGSRWQAVREIVTPLLTAEEDGVRHQAMLLATDALLGEEKAAEALALLDSIPSSPVALARRAEVAARSADPDEGVRRLTELAASSDPQQALAAVQALHRLERYADSIAPLVRITTERPDHAVAVFLLGAAYERSGRRDLAETTLRRTIELAPEFHAALNYLGYTFADGGYNLEEAVQLVRRAIALDPDNGAYVDSLGWAFFRQGKNEEAQLLLERAARLEPEDAVLHEHLGDVYAALGHKARAREAYQRALDLDDEGNRDQVKQKLLELGSSTPR